MYNNKINKHTLGIENEQVELDGVKETDIIIIKKVIIIEAQNILKHVEKEHRLQLI